MRYCKKCGKQVEDDAVFCSGCGVKLDAESERNQKDSERKSSGCLIAIFAFLLIGIALIVVLVQSTTGRSSSGSSGDSNVLPDVIKQLVSRDANTNDIEIDCELNMSALGVDLVVTPHTDITDLQIMITYYEKNGNVIQRQVVSLGNVKEGVQIKRTVSITDLSFFDALKVDKTSMCVVGGTVYYWK